MTDAIIVEERPDRWHVTLNRPEARNAINQQMVDELHEVCAELEATPRILILTGAAGTFASGADIRQLRERRRGGCAGRHQHEPVLPHRGPADAGDRGGRRLRARRRRRTRLRRRFPDRESLRHDSATPKPSSGSSLRPARCGACRALVGETVAKEVLLAGRVLTADEALSVHLVSEVHDPRRTSLAAANDLAGRILQERPDCRSR